MDDSGDQIPYSNDELYHIFNFGDSTICLVCNTTISGKTSLDSKQRRVYSHLRSPGHMESKGALFQMCVPDPACYSDDGIYLDIVTKSVFDISLLLGEESSYICQKNRHLVCLMCDAPISEISSSFNKIKHRISQHLESAEHTSSIKEVCWFYRLTPEKEYLLFHKSIIHCSVCQVTLECDETKLLQTIVFHLQSNSHEIGQHFKNPKLERQTVNGLKMTESNSQYFGGSRLSEENNQGLIKLEIKDENVSAELIEQIKGGHRHLLNNRETVTFENKGDETNVRPAQFALQTSKATITSPTSTVVNEQSLPDNSYCRTGSELLEEFMKDTCPFISNHRQFLYVKDKTMVCTLCCKIIGPISNTKMKFERALLGHTASKEHFKLLNSLKSKREKMQSVHELFGNSDINYFKALFDGVKSHILCGVLNLGLHPKSSRPRSIQNSSNLQQKVPDGISDQLSPSQYGECSHHGRPKVLGKCKTCLKNLLRNLCPDLKNQFIYLLVPSDNKCICKVCRNRLSFGDLGFLKSSYITHCESKEHKQRLNEFLLNKQKRKEKRKRVKERKRRHRQRKREKRELQKKKK